MFNIADIIHAVRNDSSVSSLVAEAKEPSEVQASVPPLEKKRPSRRQRSSGAVKPTADPNPSLIEQTTPKISEAITAAPITSISKCDCVVGLLRRESGATIHDLMAATNWQAHSVRGFLSGTVRKKLGLNLISEVNGEGARRYRIEAVTKAEVSTDINQDEPIDLPAFGPFRIPKDMEAAVSDQVL